MREFLIVTGFLTCAVALRLCRVPAMRKSGALLLLGVTFLIGYYVTGCWCVGVIAMGAWFMLPWIELLTRVRHLRLPMDNRLSPQMPPKDAFFPNAVEAVNAMEEAGFEHVEDSGWEWAGMQQYFRIYWHPEELSVGTVCLCEHEHVAFAFVSLTSKGRDGALWRTTNFPFSPTLKCPPQGISWNHVPCEQSCFHAILREHQHFLSRSGQSETNLMMPDPDELVTEIQEEMESQIRYNVQIGLLEKVSGNQFRYSRKGLMFLWRQQVRDMVRLC